MNLENVAKATELACFIGSGILIAGSICNIVMGTKYKRKCLEMEEEMYNEEMKKLLEEEY
jgi:hypothetical protein